MDKTTTALPSAAVPPTETHPLPLDNDQAVKLDEVSRDLAQLVRNALPRKMHFALMLLERNARDETRSVISYRTTLKREAFITGLAELTAELTGQPKLEVVVHPDVDRTGVMARCVEHLFRSVLEVEREPQDAVVMLGSILGTAIATLIDNFYKYDDDDVAHYTIGCIARAAYVVLAENGRKIMAPTQIELPPPAVPVE